MRDFIFLLVLPFLAEGRDFTLQLKDEMQAPLAAIPTRIILSRRDDPRYSSQQTIDQTTGPDGALRFKADEAMVLSRVQINPAGFYPIDANPSRDPLEVAGGDAWSITLPRIIAPIPLRAKRVGLNLANKTLPAEAWLGYDFAMGTALPPYGHGLIADIELRLTPRQVGWNESPESLAEKRLDYYFAEFSTDKFARHFGRWMTQLQVRFPEKNSGMVRAQNFWTHCALKMPHHAPLSGYQSEFEFTVDSQASTIERSENIGYFIRSRTQAEPSGKIISAYYAKIMGPIEFSHTGLTFTYYANPTANDTNLEYDIERNLLKAPTGSSALDEESYIIRRP